MSDELTFLDTNVLIYAYDQHEESKRATAEIAVAALWESTTGLLSTQVLQEFYVNATRKLASPLTPVEARHILELYGAWPTFRPEVSDIVLATELEEQHAVNFWDALIVVAAQRMGASVLLTEDLQDGRRFGDLVVRNPFA